MTNKTDGERLERVETNLENLTALVRETNDNVKAIQTAQQEAKLNNVTRHEHEASLAILRTEMRESKRKSALQVWLTGSLSALFGVVLTLLLTYVVTDIIGK